MTDREFWARAFLSFKSWHSDGNAFDEARAHPSEGAAVEFGYALAQRLVNPKSKILIVVSGARAIDDRAFFSLHPAVDMRFATHEEAWLYINLIKDATESVVGLIKNAAQGP